MKGTFTITGSKKCRDEEAKLFTACVCGGVPSTGSTGQHWKLVADEIVRMTISHHQAKLISCNISAFMRPSSGMQK